MIITTKLKAFINFCLYTHCFEEERGLRGRCSEGMRIEKISGKFGPARGRGKCSPLPFSLAPYLPAAQAMEKEVRTGLETSVVLKFY